MIVNFNRTRVVDTIAALRLFGTAKTDSIYMVKELNHLGGFYYDDADTTSADNGYTVIVADNDIRFKVISLTEVKFSKTFDGTTGDGEVGAVTIDDFTIPTGYFIEEALVDVGAGLTSAGAAYITVGLATDDVDAAIDQTDGLMTTLNSNVVSKIYGAFTVTTGSRLIVMAVGDTDITAGTINVILRLKKF